MTRWRVELTVANVDRYVQQDSASLRAARSALARSIMVHLSAYHNLPLVAVHEMQAIAVLCSVALPCGRVLHRRDAERAATMAEVWFQEWHDAAVVWRLRKDDSAMPHTALRRPSDLSVDELCSLADVAICTLQPPEHEDQAPSLDVSGGDLVEELSARCVALGLTRNESELDRDDTRWCPRCAMHRLGEHVDEETSSTAGEPAP